MHWQQTDLLNHDDDVVRYWAAVGFAAYAQRSKEKEPFRDEVNVYPIRQALDMYFYMYQGAPLFYEDDKKYLNVSERTFTG